MGVGWGRGRVRLLPFTDRLNMTGETHLHHQQLSRPDAHYVVFGIGCTLVQLYSGILYTLYLATRPEQVLASAKTYFIT